MVRLLVPVLFVAATTIAAAQSPLAPVRIEPPGGGVAIVVTATGVEQDPVAVAAKWDARPACLADLPCFVASWIAANAAGSLDNLKALRAPAERPQLDQRLRDPQVLARNSARFAAIKKWSFLGWVDYGTYRIVLLVHEDNDSPVPGVYTLPLKKTDTQWTQTDTLASDSGIYEMVDKMGRVILARHQKR